MINDKIKVEEQPKTTLTKEQREIFDIMGSMGITKQLNDGETFQFVNLCLMLQLNPLKREIYVVKFKNKDGTDTMNFIVGYQTYILKAYATGQVDYWGVNINTQDKDGNDTPNMKLYADFYIKRKDSTKEMTWRIYFNEYSTGMSMWVKKPKFMLEKCAIANGFRRAFPLELGQMPYTAEEQWNKSEDNEKDIEKNIKLEGIKNVNK